MPTFEITVPGANPSAVQMTLQVDAADWLEAMRLGLDELGQDPLPPAVRCTTQPDGTRRVHDDSRGRTFFVRHLAPPAAPADTPTPPAPSPLPPPPQTATDTMRGRIPAGALEPRPANPFRQRAPAGRYPALSATASTEPRLGARPTRPVPVRLDVADPEPLVGDERPRTDPYGDDPRLFSVRARPEVAAPPADDEPVDRTEVDLPLPRLEGAFEATPEPPPSATPEPPRRYDPQAAPTMQVAAIDPAVARRIARGEPAAAEPGDGARLRRAQQAPTQVLQALDPRVHGPSPTRDDMDRAQQRPTERMAALPQPPRAARRAPPTPPPRPDGGQVLTRALPDLERPHLTAEQVIDAALDLARDHIACGGIQLLLPTPRLDRFQVVTALGASASDVTRAKLHLERWLADLVVDREAATRLVDLDAVLSYERPQRRTTALRVDSLLWVPVRHRARLLAVLVLVDAPGVSGFTESDSRALDALAATLAKSLAKHL